MHSRLARLASMLVISGGATAILFGTAFAGTTTSYPTTVTITGGGPTGAQGTVSSSYAACENGRTIHLLREGSEVGSAQTDANGAWSVNTSLFAGNYQAKVDAKTITVSTKKADSSKKKKKKKKKKKRKKRSCLGGTSLSMQL